ncbi:MAG TPA: proton-conducting transporter membrane subunit [Candidatus Limnocylindria bacterium]|nr:proton-conducting transporter membrane subunit [Candidatus Limnocylindria bacterium]
MNGIVLVLIVPFFTAIALALLREHPRIEKTLAVAATVGLTVYVVWLLRYVDTHGVQAAVLGGFLAPYGIAFVADRLACIMLCLSMTVGTVVVAYTCFTVTPLQQRHFFFPFFQVLLLGVNWSFVTGDLFNLFVAYEVMLIGSYGAMMVGATRQQVRQTMMYVAVNLLGGGLFVVGIALVYALAGTLNMADLATRTTGLEGPRAAALTAASMVLLLVFALKAAAFPLFFWLPDSYPVVPAGVNGYFAGLLTKVGVYSLLRVFVMVFRQDGQALAIDVLLALSAFTMLLGVLGALCQWEMRRILSWHIISQVGYMVMGIGLAGDAAVAPLAVAATIFYVVHHIVVKASLFLIAGVTEQVTGTGRLKQMGGVLGSAPIVAGLFLVAALSLAGMPPFSGFLAKLVVLRAGLADGQSAVVAVAVVTSFLTLLSMMKIWTYAYWGTPAGEHAPTGWRGPAAASAVLVAATVVLGSAAEPFLRLADAAAHDVVTPTAYVRAVLGDRVAEALQR